MSYGRTPAQRAGDYARSKVFEHRVRQELPDDTIDRTESATDLDWYVPAGPGRHPLALDAKEKTQRYSTRWHLLPGTPEPDLFILDEISFRKARIFEDEHAVPAFFVLHDVPGGRLFLAGTDELSLVDRVRVNRIGPGGHPKGKLVLDLGHLHQVALHGLHEAIQVFIANRRKDWGWSGIVSQKPEIPHA